MAAAQCKTFNAVSWQADGSAATSTFLFGCCVLVCFLAAAGLSAGGLPLPMRQGEVGGARGT